MEGTRKCQYYSEEILLAVKKCKYGNELGKIDERLFLLSSEETEEGTKI